MNLLRFDLLARPRIVPVRLGRWGRDRTICMCMFRLLWLWCRHSPFLVLTLELRKETHSVVLNYMKVEVRFMSIVPRVSRYDGGAVS